MNKFAAVILLAVTFSAVSARASGQSEVPAWLVGYWAQVADEDGSPGDDTLEIRADGSVISYTRKCVALPTGELHLYRGNGYVTYTTRKGLISLLFVPSSDHKTLTFTSVRTGNNSVYALAKSCTPVEG
jgi:hypothetical protein